MANMVGRIGWRITTIAVGIPVGIVAKKAVERAWLAARPDDPPHRAKDPNTQLGDALGWAALSAVGIAATQLLTRRWAAAVWRSLTGAEPPGTATESAADSAADSAPAEGAKAAAAG
jgi:hypothetical protein